MRDGQQIQIEVEATFLVMLGAHMNILSIMKVKKKLLMLSGPIRPPHLCSLLNLEQLSYF